MEKITSELQHTHKLTDTHMYTSIKDNQKWDQIELRTTFTASYSYFDWYKETINVHRLLQTMSIELKTC